MTTFLEQLNTYGLTKDDANSDGLSLSQVVVEGVARQAISIPYDIVDIVGVQKPYGFMRYRILGSSDHKYHQPHKGVHARFSALYPNWDEVRSDLNTPIIITEGELKAACLCKHGFPTISIAGVSMWHPAKVRKTSTPTLLQELVDMRLKGRKVYVAFDSDLRINPGVRREMNDMMFALLKEGAQPLQIDIPNLPGHRKTGIDDFILSEGKEAFQNLMSNAVSGAEVSQIEVLAGRLGFCPIEDRFYYLSNLNRFDILKKSTLVDLLKGDFPQHDQRRSLLDTWLEHPQRRIISGSTMLTSPNAGKWISTNGEMFANVYIPDFPPYSPRPDGLGEERMVEPFTGFLHNVLSAQEDYRTFLLWLGHPLVRPDIPKLQNYVYLFSRSQGTGKSLLMSMVRHIYGNNGYKTSLEEITGRFNPYTKYLFTYCDEAVRNRKEASDLVNAMKELTSTNVCLREMYTPPRNIVSLTNYMFATNNIESIAVEADDRRAIVIHLKERPYDAGDCPHASRFYAWLFEQEHVNHDLFQTRISYIYSYLIDYYHIHSIEEDITSRLTAKRAIIKNAVVEAGLDTVAATVKYLLIDGGIHEYISDYPYDLIETNKLLELVRDLSGFKASSRMLTSAIETLNLVRLPQSNILIGGTKRRFVAFQRLDFWRGVGTKTSDLDAYVTSMRGYYRDIKF